MCQQIQRTLTEETMKNIASAFFTNNKKLSSQDISYIKDSETKFLLLYPIDARLYDKLALLKYFKQSLTRRFLMEIDIETKKARTKRNEESTLLGEAEDITKRSILKEEIEQTGKNRAAVWNMADNQLLFNFKNSFKDD